MAQHLLLDALPAIYREAAASDVASSRPAFLENYLKAFEKLLFGIDDGVVIPDVGGAYTGGDFPPRSFEESIARIADCFVPLLPGNLPGAPDDFLPWLSDWVAFSLRLDMTPAQQRGFIANAAQFYRQRGTLGNMQTLLGLFLGGVPEVTEDDDRPHSFTVTMNLPPYNVTDATRQAQVDQLLKIAAALIEIEKPAHTVYRLVPSFPSMRINVASTVGVDTILGVAKY